MRKREKRRRRKGRETWWLKETKTMNENDIKVREKHGVSLC